MPDLQVHLQRFISCHRYALLYVICFSSKPSLQAQCTLFALDLPNYPQQVNICCRQVAPRHLLLADPSRQAHFALYAFSASMHMRRPVNTHIVVIGASDCGLSVVESLLFNTSLSFNAITLISPGGVGGQAMHSSHWLDSLVGPCAFCVVMLPNLPHCLYCQQTCCCTAWWLICMQKMCCNLCAVMSWASSQSCRLKQQI